MYTDRNISIYKQITACFHATAAATAVRPNDGKRVQEPSAAVCTSAALQQQQRDQQQQQQRVVDVRRDGGVGRGAFEKEIESVVEAILRVRLFLE